jgi:hypothetical protein
MNVSKTYLVPNQTTDMEFDEWSAMEEPTFMLPEVWVRVTGIPSDVRNDYIALWALGSLFGKTMEVDMAFTRKTKVLRLRIGCMDASLIPETSDVYISRGFFRLGFEVENKNFQGEMDMAEGPQDNGGNDDGNGGNGGNGDDNNNGINRDDVMHMEVEKTMNLGANQGVVGNNNNIGLQQNSLVLTFGSLPPSPIIENVTIPHVFPAVFGSHKELEVTGKNLTQKSVQNQHIQQFSSRPEKDREVGVFQTDSALDHELIIRGDRPIIGASVSVSVDVHDWQQPAEVVPTAAVLSPAPDCQGVSQVEEMALYAGDTCNTPNFKIKRK